QAREHGAPVIAVTNIVSSAITRLSDAVLYLQAGPEIGVVATKTFVSSVAVLYLLGLYLGQQRQRINPEQMQEFLDALDLLPEQIQQILNHANSEHDSIEPLAKRMAH